MAFGLNSYSDRKYNSNISWATQFSAISKDVSIAAVDALNQLKQRFFSQKHTFQMQTYATEQGSSTKLSVSLEGRPAFAFEIAVVNCLPTVQRSCAFVEINFIKDGGISAICPGNIFRQRSNSADILADVQKFMTPDFLVQKTIELEGLKAVFPDASIY